jgi:polysaccharide export outer membrane protein
VIEIRVSEEPDLNGQFTLSSAGTIELSSLGEVDLAGLSADEAAVRIERVLETRMLQQATVAVRIREFRSKPINVIGAVTSPGPLSASGRFTLLEALTAAGGLLPDAGSTIHVLRRAANGLSDQVQIGVADLLLDADPRVNIPVFAGDLINVPQAKPIVIFLLGEFSGQGELRFDSDERVGILAAVAKAGGLSNRASKKIVIKRQGAQGLVQETPVDYKAILAGKEPDVQLRDGDILLAKKSFL